MSVRILIGDCRERLRELPSESVHCVVTSPPYFGLRDYGMSGQIGLEAMPDDFVQELVAVFREVRRVLRADGTLWLNLGDSYCTRSVRRDDGMRSVAKNFNGENEMPTWSEYAERGRAVYSSAFKHLGLKDKDLFGIPWMVAFALRADGWYLRQDIIWAKRNVMLESITDRCTKSHEYLFLLSKSERYFYDADAIKEDAVAEDLGSFDGGAQRLPDGSKANDGRNFRKPRESKKRGEFAGKTNALPGREAFRAITLKRNKRSVWHVATQPFSGAHFATFPPALIEPCILAGCPLGGMVLDPFGGAGTTGLVADRLKRDAILIELNPDYAAMAERRIRDEAGMFADVAIMPDARPGVESLCDTQAQSRPLSTLSTGRSVE